MAASLQDQIYIISGAFGSVCLLLIITVIYLIYYVVKLNKITKRNEENDLIAKRGYEVYKSAQPTPIQIPVIPDRRPPGGGDQLNNQQYNRQQSQYQGPRSQPNVERQQSQYDLDGQRRQSQYEGQPRSQGYQSPPLSPPPGNFGYDNGYPGYDNRGYDQEEHERKKQQNKERNAQMMKMGGNVAGKDYKVGMEHL